MNRPPETDPLPIPWHFPLRRPHAGVPLGNGTQGLLCWGDETLCITIARTGFWDLRDGRDIPPGTTFKKLRQALVAGDDAALASPFPTKKSGEHKPQQLGGGRLEFTFPAGLRPLDATLDLATATVHIRVGRHRDDAPKVLRIVQAHEDEVCWIEGDADLLESISAQIHLAFDEWNVWRWKNLNPPGFQPWCHAPQQVEQTYTMAEAVIFGSLLLTLLLTLLRNADRVRIANLAQLVNAIAPIMTTPGGSTWRQCIFYPFQHAARWGKGEVIPCRVSSPTCTTEEFGEVPFVEAVAVRDPVTAQITIFAINRKLDGSLQLQIPNGLEILEHITLTHADPGASNRLGNPDSIRPTPASESGVLPSLSWNVLRLSAFSNQPA